MFLVCDKIMYLHRFHRIWAQLTPGKLSHMTQAGVTRGKPSQGVTAAWYTCPTGNPGSATVN